MRNEILIVVTTVETPEQAASLAREAVAGGIAACAQVEPPVSSYFFWEGKLQEERETRVMFKTVPGHRERLLGWLRAGHPYKVPEILHWEAGCGDPAYARWAAGG